MSRSFFSRCFMSHRDIFSVAMREMKCKRSGGTFCAPLQQRCTQCVPMERLHNIMRSFYPQDVPTERLRLSSKEQGIMNIEGVPPTSSFFIRYSLFDIHFTNPSISNQSPNLSIHLSVGIFCLRMPNPCFPFSNICNSAGCLASSHF